MTNRTFFPLEVLAIVQVPGALSTPNPSLRNQSAHPSRPRPALAIGAVALAALLPLAGCGVDSTIPTGAITADNAITGRVHGGQQPVIGATVTLYAPGTSGYGSAPTALATTTTDSSGNFTLPRPYTTSCPANSPVTYILATGGNPGAGANPFLAEAALLPACSSLSASTYIYISEVTTVVAAYALAPFATVTSTATSIGTSSTNLLGLANTLGPANNLVNTATGQAVPASALAGIIPPTAEINTLANILSACVNTNTVAGTSGTCSALFAAATPPGTAVAPGDTFQAAINIALNPGNNAAALYGLSTAIAPYQPTLGTAPTDFAVGLQYNGALIADSDATQGIDIDSSGNAWVATQFNLGQATVPFGNINVISPSGVYISGTNGYLYQTLGIPYGVAIDASGNAWIAEYYYGGVAVLPSSGTNPSLFGPPSLDGPVGIAVNNRDTSAWLGNFYGTTTVTHMTSAGADAPGSPYGGQDAPLGVAIDATGNIWVANSDDTNTGSGNGYLTKFSPSGSAYTQANFATGPQTLPFDLAIDNSGNVWVTDAIGIAQFNNAGTQLSPVGGYIQSPNTNPESIIVDGLGRVWASNFATDTSGNTLGIPGSITAVTNAGTLISTSFTPTSTGNFLGYTAAGILPQVPYAPQGIKIDASGNIWITGSNVSGLPFVTELIGIAAPVVTPLSVASSTNTLGTRP